MTVDTKQCASAFLVMVLFVAFFPAIAFANAHPHPRPDSLPYLDQSTYIRNMAVRAHVGGENRRWKMQMMSLGERRFLFQGGIPKGDVIEVTDPLNPVVINEDAFAGRQIQLAYNADIGKWILMTGAAPPLRPSSIRMAPSIRSREVSYSHQAGPSRSRYFSGISGLGLSTGQAIRF